MKNVGLLLIIAVLSLSLWSQTSVTSYDMHGNQISGLNKLQTLNPSSIKTASYSWYSAGPYGGDIYDIAFAPGNPDIAFVAAGLPYFRNSSSDDWHILENLTNLSPGGINTFEASENGIIYAAGASSFYTIYKSEDDGETWSSVSVPIAGSCLDIQIDPSDPDIIYITSTTNLSASQNKVIARSTDGGLSWTPFDMTAVLPIGWACVNIAIDPDDSQTIFAIGNESFSNARVVASFDGGSSWSNVSGNLPFGKPYNSVTLYDGDAYVCGGQLFGGNVMGIYKSDNSGSSWENISNNFPNKVVNALLINPENSMRMYAATEGDGVYYTVNGGLTWNFDTGGDGDNGSVRTLTFIPGDLTEIHAGYLSLGVMISTNSGADWESSTVGIASLITNDIETSGTFLGQVLAGFEAENSGGCYLADEGEWTLVESLPATRFSTVDIDINGTLYAWSNGPTTVGAEGLYKSADNGASWENLGPDIGSVFETQIWSVAISQTDPNLIFLAGNNFGANGWASVLYKSIDGGTEWVNVFSGPDYESFRYIFIDPNSNDQIIYTAYKSQDNKGGFMKSIDGGNNWTPINANLPAEAKWASAIVSDPNDSNILYGGIGGQGGITAALYRSEDAGANWEATNLGLSNYSKFTDILVNPTNSDVIYVSTTQDGVYITSDGENWESANDGMPTNRITGFSRFFEYADDSLGFFASTSTNSAFHTSMYDPTGVGIENTTEQVSVKVYPNPSTGRFYIISNSNYSRGSEVKILNSMGKEVYRNTIKNNTVVDIEVNLPKGLYILQIKKQNEIVASGKLIIR